MDKNELKRLNEELKKRSLTESEWKEIDEFIETQPKSFVDVEMAAICPLLAIKYKPSKIGYALFLEIVCKTLSEDEEFSRKGYRAFAEKKECGDGSGYCLSVADYSGMTIARASALEEYCSFMQMNGAKSLDDFVKEFLSVIP